MILETSALVAILFNEPDAKSFAAAIDGAARTAISAPSLVETTMVAEGRTGAAMRLELDRLIEAIGPEIVPFTAAHAAIARDAWRRCGNGRDLGGCFAYALASERGQALLFEGGDLSRTDGKAAI